MAYQAGIQSATYPRYSRNWLATAGLLLVAAVAVRFAAHFPGVSSAIVGTRQIAHLCRNTSLVARGALPEAVVAAVRARFQEVGATWPSKI